MDETPVPAASVAPVAPVAPVAKATPVVKAARSFKIPFFSCAAVSVVLVLVIVGGGIGGYVLYKNNADAAAQSVVSLTSQRDTIQAQLVDAQRQIANLSDTTCDDQTVDIRFGTFTIPCGWHSYFEYQGAETSSHGYLNDGPILLLGQSDAPTGKAIVAVMQYSEDFGNNEDNPLQTVIDSLVAEGATTTTVTNDNGIEFTEVSIYVELRGETLSAYFAQTEASGTTYIVEFGNEQAGDFVEPAMLSFEWTV